MDNSDHQVPIAVTIKSNNIASYLHFLQILRFPAVSAAFSANTEEQQLCLWGKSYSFCRKGELSFAAASFLFSGR